MLGVGCDTAQSGLVNVATEGAVRSRMEDERKCEFGTY